MEIWQQQFSFCISCINILIGYEDNCVLNEEFRKLCDNFPELDNKAPFSNRRAPARRFVRKEPHYNMKRVDAPKYNLLAHL